MVFHRLITEECYPWEGRMSTCAVPKKKKESLAQCPSRVRSNNDHLTKTRLHRVGPVYRVATEEGIMHEILTSGPVQGKYVKQDSQLISEFYYYNLLVCVYSIHNYD